MSDLRAALSASEDTRRRLKDEAAAARARAERLNAKIASGRELLEHGKAIVQDRDRCISQLEAEVKVKSRPRVMWHSSGQNTPQIMRYASMEHVGTRWNCQFFLLCSWC